MTDQVFNSKTEEQIDEAARLRFKAKQETDHLVRSIAELGQDLAEKDKTAESLVFLMIVISITQITNDYEKALGLVKSAYLDDLKSVNEALSKIGKE
jgi:hypothetical protein